MGYAGARIKYTVRITFCPRCNNKLSKPRRFGPTQVRCGQCGTILQTNLTEWANLSAARKVLVAASEIILPSWIGVSGLMGTFLGLITQGFLCMMVSLVPFMLLNIVSPEGQTDPSTPFF